jgi:hypothetical protein
VLGPLDVEIIYMAHKLKVVYSVDIHLVIPLHYPQNATVVVLLRVNAWDTVLLTNDVCFNVKDGV